MRFELDPDVQLFAASVRGALGGWQAPLEPDFLAWQDDRDDELAVRLAALGWSELWTEPGLLAPAVAGALELGRAVAPLCLLDEAALGAPLAVRGRVRHGQALAATALPAGGLAIGAVSDGTREPALDGTGTLRGARVAGEPVPDAGTRWAVWGAATLGYAAGLASAALDTAVAHVASREQFGAPLAALPAVQGRLADAFLLAEGLVLSAWAAAADGADGLPAASLAWAGPACREVAAHVQQVHGGLGFALESGIHRYYRRAKSLHVWTDAVLAETAGS